MRSPGCLRNCMLPLQDSHPTNERPNQRPAPRMMHAPVVSQLFAVHRALPARQWHHCLHARTYVVLDGPRGPCLHNELVWSPIRPQSDPPFLFLPKAAVVGAAGQEWARTGRASATWWSPPKSCLPACRDGRVAPAPRRTHVRGGRGERMIDRSHPSRPALQRRPRPAAVPGAEAMAMASPAGSRWCGPPGARRFPGRVGWEIIEPRCLSPCMRSLRPFLGFLRFAGSVAVRLGGMHGLDLDGRSGVR